mmetsp:Transcript_71842/g.156432  ORF Transcript_71842/g.156432 Transcript_71842/m.156432 type:complete len:292 (-) Transcript_71842:759-1634(-)
MQAKRWKRCRSWLRAASSVMESSANSPLPMDFSMAGRSNREGTLATTSLANFSTLLDFQLRESSVIKPTTLSRKGDRKEPIADTKEVKTSKMGSDTVAMAPPDSPAALEAELASMSNGGASAFSFSKRPLPSCLMAVCKQLQQASKTGSSFFLGFSWATKFERHSTMAGTQVFKMALAAFFEAKLQSVERSCQATTWLATGAPASGARTFLMTCFITRGKKAEFVGSSPAVASSCIRTSARSRSAEAEAPIAPTVVDVTKSESAIRSPEAMAGDAFSTCIERHTDLKSASG